MGAMLEIAIAAFTALGFVAIVTWATCSFRAINRNYWQNMLDIEATFEGEARRGGYESLVLMNTGKDIEEKTKMDLKAYRAKLVEIVRENPNMSTSEVAKAAHGLKVAHRVYPMTYRTLQALRKEGVLGCRPESNEGARWWVLPDRNDVDALTAFLDED